MSVELLDNTRRIEKLLHEYSAPRIEFSDICGVMSDILKSDVYVIGQRGRVLGRGVVPGERMIPALACAQTGSRLDQKINQRLVNVLSTSENTDPGLLGIENPNGCRCLVSPVVLAGSRLGTLLVTFRDRTLSIDDIIICEFGATVIGMEIFRSLKEEKAADLRSEQNVKAVVETLSRSEMTALRAVLARVKRKKNDEKKKKWGVVVNTMVKKIRRDNPRIRPRSGGALVWFGCINEKSPI